MSIHRRNRECPSRTYVSLCGSNDIRVFIRVYVYVCNIMVVVDAESLGVGFMT